MVIYVQSKYTNCHELSINFFLSIRPIVLQEHVFLTYRHAVIYQINQMPSGWYAPPSSPNGGRGGMTGRAGERVCHPSPGGIRGGAVALFLFLSFLFQFICLSLHHEDKDRCLHWNYETTYNIPCHAYHACCLHRHQERCHCPARAGRQHHGVMSRLRLHIIK